MHSTWKTIWSWILDGITRLLLFFHPEQQFPPPTYIETYVLIWYLPFVFTFTVFGAFFFFSLLRNSRFDFIWSKFLLVSLLLTDLLQITIGLWPLFFPGDHRDLVQLLSRSIMQMSTVKSTSDRSASILHELLVLSWLLRYRPVLQQACWIFMRAITYLLCAYQSCALLTMPTRTELGVWNSVVTTVYDHWFLFLLCIQANWKSFKKTQDQPRYLQKDGDKHSSGALLWSNTMCTSMDKVVCRSTAVRCMFCLVVLVSDAYMYRALDTRDWWVREKEAVNFALRYTVPLLDYIFCIAHTYQVSEPLWASHTISYSGGGLDDNYKQHTAAKRTEMVSGNGDCEDCDKTE